MNTNTAVQDSQDFITLNGPVLIVDDEKSIRQTLESIFTDEGIESITAKTGEEALEVLKTVSPSLVLLDIWMPGMDGIETLRVLRERYPDLPVIMISGHATIATAVQATQMGAQDFLEKPLELKKTLSAVYRALGREESSGEDTNRTEGINGEADQFRIGGPWDISRLNRIVFESQKFLAGRRFSQKTLAKSAVLYGQGLHSGRKSGLILEPLPADSGIHFIGMSGATPIPAHIDFVESTGFATTIGSGENGAGTIEHLMSALHAYGISNLLIKCNGEVPILDGSAIQYCDLFDDVGVKDQDGDWYEIEVREPFELSEGRESIRIEPADEFIIHYILEYPDPVGHQEYEFVFGDVEAFKKEIAPARSFGFVKDIGYLQKQGLAQGGRFDNIILIGEDGAINDSLRFPDELPRHKVLDAIGDLFLLGRRLRGKVTANMTGHSDNCDLLKLIRQAMG